MTHWKCKVCVHFHQNFYSVPLKIHKYSNSLKQHNNSVPYNQQNLKHALNWPIWLFQVCLGSTALTFSSSYSELMCISEDIAVRGSCSYFLLNMFHTRQIKAKQILWYKNCYYRGESLLLVKGNWRKGRIRDYFIVQRRHCQYFTSTSKLNIFHKTFTSEL